MAIPFDFEYPDYGPPARSELKQFGALIWAVAKARFKQRLSAGNALFAQLEDFATAVALWSLRQPAKVDETSIKILNELGDEEPKEDYDEKGRVIGFNPQPITSTIIAKRLKMKPRRVSEALNHLYNMGYVDRKAIGGRGNPYAYWKSAAYLGVCQTPKSLSPIRLKDPISEANDYFAEIKTQYSVQPQLWESMVKEWTRRAEEAISKLCSVSPEIISKPEFGSVDEKKPDHLGVSNSPKLLGSPAIASETVNEGEAVRVNDLKTAPQAEEPISGVEVSAGGWDGFHCVGYMTPEKAYQKTVQILAAAPKETGHQVLTKAKLWEVLGYFWNQDSFNRVLEKLVINKVLKPLEEGEYLIYGCCLCGKQLPADLKNTTVLEGKYVHMECYLSWKKEQGVEKVAKRQPSTGDMVKLLRSSFPQKFVEIEFLKFAVDSGWSQGDAEDLLKTLEKEGSIFKTSEGTWVWA